VQGAGGRRIPPAPCTLNSAPSFKGCTAGGEQRSVLMVDPDFALLDATSRGDRDAFESLVKRYQSPLLNFIARYLGDRAMAEDLTQEAFLRIYRAAPRFEAKTKVSTWVFRIAYNLVLTEIDRRRRQQNVCDALCRSREEDALEQLAKPSEPFELEEEIISAIAGLPGSQRAALLLRINEDLSYLEIGEVLGVGVQSVESLLFRARKNLRQSLGRTRKQGVNK
jgi:RNA polymerase sigma-70 factor, ECF subfamily